MTGRVAIDPRGASPARFIDRGAAEIDYRYWITDDVRRDSSRCVRMPPASRERLARQARPRPSAEGGVALFQVDMIAQQRLVIDKCAGQPGELLAVSNIVKVRAVPCGRDTFVAHGFVCPAGRRAPERESEIFGDRSDYYPLPALREEMEGIVKVRVTLDATGSPVGCAVIKSSGNDLLDRHTCKLIGTDPAFTVPRTPAAGGDLSGTITQQVVWALPVR